MIEYTPNGNFELSALFVIPIYGVNKPLNKLIFLLFAYSRLYNPPKYSRFLFGSSVLDNCSTKSFKFLFSTFNASFNPASESNNVSTPLTTKNGVENALNWDTSLALPATFENSYVSITFTAVLDGIYAHFSFITLNSLSICSICVVNTFLYLPSVLDSTDKVLSKSI